MLKRNEPFRHSVADLRPRIENADRKFTKSADFANKGYSTRLLSVAEELTKEERVRNKVVNEIATTERGYVLDMEIVVDVFMNAIKNSNLLTPGQITGIFSNVEAILGINTLTIY
jgi:hypothetical protein